MNELWAPTDRNMKRFLAAVLTILLVHPAFAQVDQEKINLWVKDYKNLPVTVVIQANDIGMTEDAARTKTELRLRQAGIRPLKSDAFVDHRLIVYVRFSGPAFSIDVAFNRMAIWGLPDQSRYSGGVQTWDVSTVGEHGSDGPYIIRALDEGLDKFLNAYLKANQTEESPRSQAYV